MTEGAGSPANDALAGGSHRSAAYAARRDEPRLVAELPAELRLLAASVLVQPPADEARQSAKVATLCDAGVDWKELGRLVVRHRLPTLACAGLERRAGERLPLDFRERLRATSRAARKRALLQSGELAAIARALATRGIRALSLKGPILSQDLYGDPTLRSSRDLDLLVAPADFLPTEELLLQAGYQRVSPAYSPSPRQARVLERLGQHREYRLPGRPTSVELHWTLYRWSESQVAALLASAVAIDWHGAPLLRLEGEWLTLVLCAHGASHRWRRLAWLADIAAIVATGRLGDWARLVERAEQLDLRLVLSQSLLLARAIFDIDLPAPASASIDRSPAVLRLAGEAMQQILAAEVALHATMREMLAERWHFARLRERGRWTDELGRTWRYLWIREEDWQEVRLPDALFPLYHALRPLLWLRRRVLG